MEKGRNMLKGSELSKQLMSCLSSGVQLWLCRAGQSLAPRMDVPAALEAQPVPAGKSRGR